MTTKTGATGSRRARFANRTGGSPEPVLTPKSVPTPEPVHAADPPSRLRTPDPLETEFDQAVDAEAAGLLDKAMGLYRNILRKKPDHVRARHRLGSLLDRAGEHATALEHFRTALEVEPQNPAVLGSLGATLGQLGRYPEAEIRLRRAMELDPESTEPALQLGILQFRRGLYARAEREIARVIARDPEIARAHLFRGKALNRLGRLDDAMGALGEAARLAPSDPTTFQLMGMVYDKKNLPREAQIMYRRAKTLTER